MGQSINLQKKKLNAIGKFLIDLQSLQNLSGFERGKKEAELNAQLPGIIQMYKDFALTFELQSSGLPAKELVQEENN